MKYSFREYMRPCRRNGAFRLFRYDGSLLLEHGFVQYLQIHIVTNTLHMPMLARTEDISRASYLEVAQRYFEARTELREIAYRGKSFRRYITECLALPVSK